MYIFLVVSLSNSVPKNDDVEPNQSDDEDQEYGTKDLRKLDREYT